jgi:hypothetical protein
VKKKNQTRSCRFSFVSVSLHFRLFFKKKTMGCLSILRRLWAFLATIDCSYRFLRCSRLNLRKHVVGLKHGPKQELWTCGDMEVSQLSYELSPGSGSFFLLSTSSYASSAVCTLSSRHLLLLLPSLMCFLQGHKAKFDNRFYILDFARLFPPEAPARPQHTSSTASHPTSHSHHPHENGAATTAASSNHPQLMQSSSGGGGGGGTSGGSIGSSSTTATGAALRESAGSMTSMQVRSNLPCVAVNF